MFTGPRGLRAPALPGLGTASSAGSIACAASTRDASRAGASTRSPSSRFPRCGLLVTYAIQRLQHVLAVQPAESCRRRARSRVQHRRELHDQHELAGVRRRDHDELPDADGGARVAQLHLGRGRNRGRRRSRARDHPALGREGPGNDRQLLGRRRACDRLSSSFRSCVVFALFLVSAGCDPEPVAVRAGRHARGRRRRCIAMGPVASQEVIKELGHQRRRVSSTRTARTRSRTRRR